MAKAPTSLSPVSLIRRAFDACFLMWRCHRIQHARKPCGSESSFHVTHLGPICITIVGIRRGTDAIEAPSPSLYNAQILQHATASPNFCVCMLRPRPMVHGFWPDLGSSPFWLPSKLGRVMRYPWAAIHNTGEASRVLQGEDE